MRKIAEKRRQQTEEELNTLKQEIATLKQQNEAEADTHDYNEADTRSYLIDVLLKEAGWNIDRPDWTEYEVEGMPNNSGKGYVDYVLWGDDGKPLAVIEAKRTRKSPTEGKRQAELYANCLEKQFNQRPVIFYSNGYTHWIWDDLSYPPREIQGFLKKDELERIIFRRSHRKSLDLVIPDRDIAGRTYQLEALKRITEDFDEKNARKSLLVMATGTGKTRTAIALVDLLRRAEWVNRILFLADRNSLLTQALRNFKTHLPTVTPIDLTKDKNYDGANVVLSTSLRDKVRDLLDRLEEKQTIPMVKQQLPLIQEVQDENWWSDVTPSTIESVRIKLRDLVKFIDRTEQTIVYTDFKDELGDVTEVDVPIKQTGFSPYQYRKKVEAYIRQHEDHIAIYKLKRNVPLTDGDLSELEQMLFSANEIESRDRFEEVYGQDVSLKLFIRKIVGLDRHAAKQAFAKYLAVNNFTANQIRFVENIIDYLTQNGVMNPGLLYEPPFTDLHYEGLDGMFDEDDADAIIAQIGVFNETVDASFKTVA